MLKGKFILKLYKKILILFLCFFMINLNIVFANTTETIEINSASAVLIDAKTGIVIYEKNMHEKMYPASITKVLTALVALDMVSDFSRRITHSHNAVFSIPVNSSHIAMNEGETLSYEEALLAIMLESANEVSNAIAEDLAESNAGFSALMNEKARSVGAVNSNFVNPHGLHDELHYTTSYDMALIMREAIQHEKFVEIISTTTSKIPPTERQINERPLNNTNRMIQRGHSHFFESAVGGKTGFTTPAGNTLVMYATKDGVELITVVMNAENSGAAYSETRTLLEYGFTQFTDVEIFNSTTYSDIINIVSEEGGNMTDLGIINIYAKEDVSLNLPSSIDINNITVEKNMPFQKSPPVYKDELIGHLSLKYNDLELARVNLYAKEEFLLPEISSREVFSETEESEFRFSLIEIVSYILLGLFFILLVIGVFARIIKFNARKKRRALRRKRQMNRDYTQRYRYKDY